MLKYFAKRLLLMIPTFIGSTLLVFGVLALIPDGPVEREIARMEAAMNGGGSGDGATSGGGGKEMVISPEVIDALKRQYGMDKPFLVRYLLWLGLYPAEIKSETAAYNAPFRETLRKATQKEGNIEKTYLVQRWVKVEKSGDNVKVLKSGTAGNYAFGKYPELPSHTNIKTWTACNDWEILKVKSDEIVMRQTAFSGILQGDLGESWQFNKPVTQLIGERMHISAYFGLIGFFLTYLVCIPLGIAKAVKHNSKFDIISSGIIFMGYSIPAYALGVLLLVLFGSGAFMGLELFPLGGFRSIDYDELSLFGKIVDQIHHTILPVICYMVGAFATLTILMKNSLMENLNQDYIRTAFAKGLPEEKVIYKHAVRNSLIPIATGLGGILGVFVAGSYLIELVFNIDGIGLLSFKAVVNSDYPIFLGFLVISILIMLFGRLLSDTLYVLIDPRIKF